MSRKFNAGYYVSEGFHSIFTHGFMSFAAVCMIVACLIIMGSFTLLAVNLDNTLGDLESENEMLVYIDDTLTQDQARALQPTLAQVDNVSQLTFVTKEAALADFKAKHGDTTSVLNDLPNEALRDRYRVHVVDIELMRQTKAALEQVEGVGFVNAATEIADGFVMVRNIATGVALVLIGILLVISLFIIANTIKPGGDRHHEDVRRHRRLHRVALCGGGDAAGPHRGAYSLLRPVGAVSDGGQVCRPGQRPVAGEYDQLWDHGAHHSGRLLRRGRIYRRGGLPVRHSEVLTGLI